MDADEFIARRSVHADFAAKSGASGAKAEDAPHAHEEPFPGDCAGTADILRHTFESIDGYDGMVLLRNIRFECQSERNAAAIRGVVHIAYLPDRHLVGISELAGVVDARARRFQFQERLTVQIANAIDILLQPKGVAVAIEARHHAVTARGPQWAGATITTSRTLGVFRNDPAMRREFHTLIGCRS